MDIWGEASESEEKLFDGKLDCEEDLAMVEE